MNDLTHAQTIVADYEALVERAIRVTADGPYYSDVEFDDNPRLIFDGDDVLLQWKNYESDGYGGGYLRDEETRFPIKYLFMTDSQLAAFLKDFKKDEREKQERLRKAQLAVNIERAEAHDRAEFVRLCHKYGKDIK